MTAADTFPIGSGVTLGQTLLTDLHTHADGLTPPRVRVEGVTGDGICLTTTGQYPVRFVVHAGTTAAVPGWPGWVVVCYGVTLGGAVYECRGFAFLSYRGMRI